MAITISNRLITISTAALVCAASVVAAVLPGTTLLPGNTVLPGATALPGNTAMARTRHTGTAQTPGRAAAVSARSAASVAGYWTSTRMRSAVADSWKDGDTMGQGLRWAHAGAVTRTTGKVFFTLDGTNYVCSGTAISSARQDVVLTAAHCVGNATGRWASNWLFVPGYRDGTQPYGAFTARKFYVSRQWSGDAQSASAERHDVAFVTVNPSNGRRLGEAVGGQPVAFGDAATKLAGKAGAGTYVFGYPSEPPFSGEYTDYCAGAAQRTSADAATDAVGLDCGMTAGDSGGPWLADFSPRTGTGTVIAVTTYKFSNDRGELYGTMLDANARELYDEANAGR
jgi:V8-like Glu-specific endopeptidase